MESRDQVKDWLARLCPDQTQHDTAIAHVSVLWSAACRRGTIRWTAASRKTYTTEPTRYRI